METVKQIHEAESRHYRRFQQPYVAFHPEGYRRLLRAAALPAEGVILDVGGGSGAFGCELARERRRRVVVCDLSRDLLLAGKKHSENVEVSWIETDAGQLPFADNSVDGIMLGSVLHHFPDFSAVARECHRCLKPGGNCVSADPNGHNWMMWLLRHPSSPFCSRAGRSDNERWLGAPEVEKVFLASGFALAGRHGVRGVVYRLATFCAQEENPPPWARLLLEGWNTLERVLGLLPAAPFCLGSWMVIRFTKPTVQ
jgi:SAM-dependent methyltransferase